MQRPAPSCTWSFHLPCTGRRRNCHWCRYICRAWAWSRSRVLAPLFSGWASTTIFHWNAPKVLIHEQLIRFDALSVRGVGECRKVHGAARGALLQQRLEVAGRHGPSEVVALTRVTSQRRQLPVLIDGFDAL